MNNNNQTNKTGFWSDVGVGIAIFLACMGIGGCIALEKMNPNVPLIQINSTFTLTNSPAVVE